MFFDIPVTESITAYIGLAIMLLGLVGLLVLIYLSLPETFRKKLKDAYKSFKNAFEPKEKKKGEPKPPPGCIMRSFQFLLTFCLIFIGFLVIMYGIYLRSYIAFTRKELVAEVTCEPIGGAEYHMQMVLTRKQGPKANMPETFLITGDQWYIRGDILKWENWLNLLGLHTFYKLTRVGGFFNNPREEYRASHYSLVPDEDNSTWRWLYENGYKLPFIVDVYGNSDYKYPALNKTFKVYVTTSGFSIETEAKADLPQ
ncbi:MAG: hypothetical protein ONB16_13025 [candidate division KSB1 bacterium]|nr:hypothetical protein [candidate division KSB1 bacterium]MDZ7318727.1 hypothetical protein [candidate division KSB1 bacterium]MDZ7341095.1 hypothetical protein [candidate division KSB1 bacterium]